ncbi:MAG: hypothetical protein OEY28_02475 [Nitrospira sp.]|nr:hypothetical protein [Nitrospira sp.]
MDKIPYLSLDEMRFREGMFLSQFDDLSDECCGFIIKPKADSCGRIHISVILPLDSDCLEPPSKRGWKRLLSTWVKRAKEYNDKTGANEVYLAEIFSKWPPELVRWIKEREWIERHARGREYGSSYQDLCDNLNKSIFKLLYEAFSTQDDDNEQWRVIAKSQFEQARYIMSFFKVSRDDQDRLIENAGKRYEKGLSLFDMIDKAHRRLKKPRPDGPISRDAVIAKLRHLKKLHPSLASKL